MDKNQTKFVLDEKDMATAWYNIQADLPEPLPPILHPATLEPTQLPPPLFCDEINKQEFSKERWIDIPEEVQSVYRLWRPTTLYRAHKLEKALDTPAKSTTNLKMPVRPAATNRIPPSRRPTIIRRPASSVSPQKLAPDSGVAPWPWLVSTSALNSKSIWSESAISRNLTGGI